MKRLFIISLLLFGTLSLYSQVNEPEFLYQCVILNDDSTITNCETREVGIKAKHRGAGLGLIGGIVGGFGGTLSTIGKMASTASSFASANVCYKIQNPHSNVIIPCGERITIICRYATNILDPHQIIKIYKLESKKKYRQVDVASFGAIDGYETNENTITYNATKYGDYSYKITLDNYSSGEYAIQIGGSLIFNCFSIKSTAL